jgi:hypothetical protein
MLKLKSVLIFNICILITQRYIQYIVLFKPPRIYCVLLANKIFLDLMALLKILTSTVEMERFELSFLVSKTNVLPLDDISKRIFIKKYITK